MVHKLGKVYTASKTGCSESWFRREDVRSPFVHHVLHLKTVIPAVKSLLDDAELDRMAEKTLENKHSL
jgi:hypothetical protein